MESSYFIGFCAVSGALLLLSVLSTLIVWNRINNLHDRQHALWQQMDEKAQPKQLEKAVMTAEGTASRVDNAVIQLQKFKEGIHAEMQRFYGIMRRNEKAIGREPPDEAPDIIPDVINPSDLRTEEPENILLSRKSLRDEARSKGMKI